MAQYQQSGFRGPINWYRNIDRNIALTPQLETARIEQPSFFIAGTRDPVLQFGGGKAIEVMEKYLADMRGKVWLLNVWASWCVSCREEHPLLVELSKKGLIPILGLNYKDQGDEAQRWLKQFGNPYDLSVVARDGRIGIDFGVYGAPETFLIDDRGVVVYKHVGAMNPDVWQREFLARLPTVALSDGTQGRP